jgi:hypothetical protein
VATAWGVATRRAVALSPDAQYPTRALAAVSALGCGAGGTTGAAVVGTTALVVVDEATGMVWTVVVGPVGPVVVGAVGGDAPFGVPQAVAVAPRTATMAAARSDRVRRGVTTPL